MRLFVILAAALVLAFNVNASAQAPSAVELKERELMFAKLKEQTEHVAALVSLSLECRTVADCSTVPMGSRACGGPTSHVIISAFNPAQKEILENVELVTQTEREINRKFGMMSICSIEMPPALACEANVCTTER